MGYAVLCWESWWSGPSSGSRSPHSFIPWAVEEISYSMQIHWNLQGSGLAPATISVSSDMRMACENVPTKQILDWVCFSSNNGTAHFKRTLWKSVQETWQVDYRVVLAQHENQEAENTVLQSEKWGRGSIPNKLNCRSKSMVWYLSWEIQFYSRSHWEQRSTNGVLQWTRSFTTWK